MRATIEQPFLRCFARGLPGTLLTLDAQKVPRYCRVMRALSERTLRRRFAKLARQDLDLCGNDREVIERFLMEPRLRQQMFWCARREAGPLDGAAIGMSLELSLLAPIAQALQPPPFEEARFIADCAAWPAIKPEMERVAQMSLAEVDPPTLAFLMCWPRLRDALSGRERLESTDWPALEAVFALSSITGSPWFLNEVLRICPGAQEWLEDLIAAGARTVQSWAVVKIVAGPDDTDAPDEDQAPGPDWQALARELAHTAERLLREPPAQWGDEQAVMLGTLERALAAVRGYDPRGARRERLDALLGQMEARVRGFPGQPAFALVRAELGGRLTQWRSRAGEAGPRQLDELITALSDAGERLEGCARRITEAHAARQQMQADHEALLAAAAERPSLATQRAVQQLSEREAAAAGALLDAQSSLLDLLTPQPPDTAPAAPPGPRTADQPVLDPWMRTPPELDRPASDARRAETALLLLAYQPELESQPRLDSPPGAGASGEPSGPEVSPAPAAGPPPAMPPDVPGVPELPVAAVSEEGVQDRERAGRFASGAPAPDTGEASAAVGVAAASEDGDGGLDARNQPALADQVWRALSRQELAVAYQLARLAEAQGSADASWHGVPPVPLLRAVTLANELLEPDGLMAADITQALAAVDMKGLREPAELRGATHLLLTAAVLRPLLLAPDSAAPELAGQLRLPDGCGQLYALVQAFREATSGLRHYRMSARAFAGLADEEVWRRELHRTEEAIQGWRERAPQYRILYQPATAIWCEWQKPGGEIGRLLAPIEEGAAAGPAVQAQLDRLRDRRQRDEAFREADRRSRRRGAPIHGAALAQFHQHVDEACALAAQWLDVIRSQPARSAPRVRERERARAVFTGHRALADRELALLSGHADARIAAAAGVARTALAQAWALFDPEGVLPAAERSPPHLLDWPLLRLTTCRVRHDGSLRDPPRLASEALAARPDALPGLMESFEARLTGGDITGAALLWDLAAVEDPATAARMSARLDPAAERHWAAQRQALARIGELIQSSIVYGVLSGAEGDDFAARLSALERQIGCLAQADAIEEGAGAILDGIHALSQMRRQQLHAALEEVRDSADPADLDLVHQALAADDLPSANEYVSRIRAGERLRDRAARPRDPFQELHGTSLAQDIEDFLARHPGDLAGVTGGGCTGRLDLSGLSAEERGQAATLLTCWDTVKRSLGGLACAEDRWARALQQLLQLLGFTRVRVRARPNAEALLADIECDPLADRAVCPVPCFGSGAQGRYRWLGVSGHAGIDSIIARVGPTQNARPTLVFCFGRLTQRQRAELAAQTRAARRSFIVLDEVLLLFLAGERGSRLPALFACALPFGHFDPYTAAASIVPPELFFGRRQELDRLLDPLGPCFVYGGRQLGKTALLKHAVRAFNAQAGGHHAAWIDLKAAHIGSTTETDSRHVWRPVWRHLVDAGLLPEATPEPRPTIRGRVEHFVETLERWLATCPEGRILLLLDEADRFLEDDARRGYPETVRLKRLMEGSDRRFKVTLAGLHNVLRTAGQANHPLGHFGEPIEIGPLIKDREWREAQRLVTGPLAAAGYTLERAGMADRILAQTNFYPGLIQLYCSKLIARMTEEDTLTAGPRFVIREQTLDEIYLSCDLRNAIRQKFLLTLQLDPRYAVIAYAIAHHAYAGRGTRAGLFTAGALSAMARGWWHEGFARTSAPELRALLDEMVGLGVLRAGEEGTYTLRNPNLLLLMGTQEEVNEELARPRDLPEIYAPDEFHTELAGPGAIAGRHPLSMTQINALNSGRDGVVILAGTPAAGIGRAAAALEQEHGESRLMLLPALTDQGSLARCLADRLAARATGTLILLVPPQCPWSGSWVQAALEELRRHAIPRRRAKVVFIADPAAGACADLPSLAQADGVALVTVRAWPEGFVRHWLEESHRADGPAERAALCALTGFWPLLMESAGADTPCSGIPLDLFAGRHTLLGRIVGTMAEYAGDGETREVMHAGEIAALIEESGEAVRDVLALAQILGLASPAALDGWRLEQGLASLWQHGRIERARLLPARPL